MSTDQIIRAWKDKSYRATIADAERHALPENPAGCVDVSDEDLKNTAGGTTTWPCLVLGTSVSALPACGATLWDGSCNVASVGCCKAVE